MGIIINANNIPLFKEKFREAANKAMERCGLQGERFAKTLAPVDTGNLRNSITHQTQDTTAYIGTNTEYAIYVEMGTVHQSAQPYLRPAVEDHKGTYTNIIKDELSKVK